MALSVTLMLAVSEGALAAKGSWHFKSTFDPIREKAGALIYYDSGNLNAPQMAFKCQDGKMPYMMLGFLSPIYEGRPERLRTYIKIDGEDEFQLGITKLVERGVSPNLLYAGVEAEVHKLWFLSDKIISYHTFGNRRNDTSLLELLAALRDGQTYFEVSVGQWRRIDRSDHIKRKVTAFSLRGSTRAVNKFAEECGLALY